MARRPLVKSILTLSASGLIVRVIGSVYRIVLVRYVGAEVIGVFQMTYPILRLCATIATAGLPIALSKVVAESLARGDRRKASAFARASFRLVLLTSLVMSVALIMAARLISSTVMTDERTMPSILVMPLALVCTCLSGVLRGFFHGQHTTTPSAVSQVIEQVTRIGVTLALGPRLLQAGVEQAAAVIVLAMGIGEASGFVSLLVFLVLRRRGSSTAHVTPVSHLAHLSADEASGTASGIIGSANAGRAGVVVELLAMSLPLTAVGFIGSISHTVDALTIPRRLQAAGLSVTDATTLFGRLSGMAIPVLFLPGLAIFPLATVLLPEVAAAASSHRQDRLRPRLRQVIGITTVASTLTALFIALGADLISRVLYGSTEAADLIRKLSPAALPLYISYVSASALNGLGGAKIVMVNTCVGTIVRFGLLYQLTAVPALQLDGAVIAMGAGLIITMIMDVAGLIHILKKIPRS